MAQDVDNAESTRDPVVISQPAKQGEPAETVNTMTGEATNSFSEPSPWPRPGDVLFLATNPDEIGPDDLTADLRYRRNLWWQYAEGYERAAQRLLAAADVRDGDADLLVYPLIFLWRHYLELALKALVPELRYLDDSERVDQELSHRLDLLWRQAHPVLLALEPSSKHLLQDVESVILQLHGIDPRSEAFRYPIAKDGSEWLPDVKAVDLRNLSEVMERIASFFSACRAAVEERVGVKMEITRYYAQEMDEYVRDMEQDYLREMESDLGERYYP
jgi:hypothetical protein